MMRRLAIAGSALALLAACGGNDDVSDVPKTGEALSTGNLQDPAANPTSPDSVPARAETDSSDSAADLTVSYEADELNASATIDGAIAAFSSSLAERLHEGVKNDIEQAKVYAREDSGNEYFNPHDYQADFIKTASVDDIISIESMTMTYAGGAHPNYTVGGLIHDRASGNDIPAATLLTEDGKAALKRILMDDLAEQKLKRMSMAPEDLPLVKQDVAEIFPKDINSWLGQVTLLPSHDVGKFGGMAVHYSPYDVGAYAEGSYDILVEASQLSGLLSETYAPMFGGEPDIEEHEEH